MDSEAVSQGDETQSTLDAHNQAVPPPVHEPSHLGESNQSVAAIESLDKLPTAHAGGNIEITCKMSTKVPETEMIEIDDDDEEEEVTDDCSAPALGHATTSKAESKDNKVGDGNQRYLCSCGESFSKTTDLAAHKRWTCKLSEKKCQCEVCDGWFAHEQSLKRHMKQAHGGVFPCDSCNLRFHNKMKLTRHWMEAHFDDKCSEKRLKCFVCNRDQFDGKYEFECHLLAHKYAKERTGAPSLNDDASRASNSNTASSTRTQPSPYPSDSSGHSPFPLHHMGHAMHAAFGHLGSPHPSHHGSAHPGHHGSAHSSHHGSTHPSHHGSAHPSHHGSPHPSHHGSPHPFHHSSLGFYPGHLGQSQYGMPSTFQPNPHDFPSAPPPHAPPPPPPPPSPPPPPPPPPLPPHWLPPPPPPHHHHPHHHRPHHQHQIPPDFPPYMERFAKFKNRMKWKHYFKTLLSNMPPSYWLGRPGSGPVPSAYHPTADKPNQGASHSQNASEKSGRGEDGMTTCQHCGKSVRAMFIQSHYKHACPVLCVHPCQVCGATFASNRVLFRHMYKQGHLNAAQADIIGASQVDGESISVSRLQEKLRSVLNFQKPDHTPGTDQPAPETSMPERRPPFEYGHKVSGGKASLAQHFSSGNTSKAQPGSSAATTNDADDLQSEKNLVIDEDSSNVWKCFVCRDTLESKSDLCFHLEGHLSHVKSVLKVREWKEKSGKFFLDKDFISEDSSSASFVTPVDHSSTSSIPLQGDSCSNISSQPSSFSAVASESDRWLKPHGKHKHDKRKRQVFQCEICSEKFAFRRDLVYHMKDKHNGRTLECPTCHKTFSWKNRAKFYQRHLQSHMGVSVFNHKCEVCGKTFLESHKLQSHMAKHKGELLHTCSVCGKGYGNKSSLLRHQRKHTGDKPLQCEVCNESFWEKRELIRHSATHTGTAPFVCSECGRGFTLKTSLMKHLKRKHSKNLDGQDPQDLDK